VTGKPKEMQTAGTFFVGERGADSRQALLRFAVVLVFLDGEDV
jgi:hypothetical protein